MEQMLLFIIHNIHHYDNYYAWELAQRPPGFDAKQTENFPPCREEPHWIIVKMRLWLQTYVATSWKSASAHTRVRRNPKRCLALENVQKLPTSPVSLLFSCDIVNITWQYYVWSIHLQSCRHYIHADVGHCRALYMPLNRQKPLDTRFTTRGIFKNACNLGKEVRSALFRSINYRHSVEHRTMIYCLEENVSWRYYQIYSSEDTS